MLVSDRVNELIQKPEQHARDIRHLIELMSVFEENDEETLDELTPVYCVFFETMSRVFQEKMVNLGKTNSEYAERYGNLVKLFSDWDN